MKKMNAKEFLEYEVGIYLDDDLNEPNHFTFGEMIELIEKYHQSKVNNGVLDDVTKRFEVGTPVTWGNLGRTFYVVEHNQFTKVLVSNLQDVNDDNYNDWWVDIDELNVL